MTYKYYRLKKSDGLVKGQVFVMLLLHFLPRIQSEPQISENVERITGHKPITIKDFILKNQVILKQG